MVEIEPGLTGEVKAIVDATLTARHLGSGDIAVYATPAMIALMEAAAVRAVDPHLPAGEASVGIGLDIRHLAATPVGHEVRARAELIAVAGRRLSLKVEAWDEQELIGEGTHERYVVNLARFMTRVKAKIAPD